MGIEGNRSSSASFKEGELLSAQKLNSLGTTADYGLTKHSDGTNTVQGQYGTVFMQPSAPVEQPGDQFQVYVFYPVDEKPWFRIIPGYCTVQDHSPIMITADAAGTVFVGDNSVDQALGINVLYKVDTCNAYGEKLYLDVDNKLENNAFTPDIPDDVTDKDVVFFLYRHTPGDGTPKLAVTSWTAFTAYFRNVGTPPLPPTSPTASPQPNYGSPAGIMARLYYGTASNYKIDPAGTGTAVNSLAVNNAWYKLGLHVQILALYNKESKQFVQYKRGHVRMTDTAETIFSMVQPDPESGAIMPLNTTTIQKNDGWHSYFYANPQADFTGLKFENPTI